MPKPSVNILLSTYNGEAFLRQQLDSLLMQTDVDFSIIVRDDGSTDGTLAILDEYAVLHTSLSIVRGQNLGPAESFMTLLAMAPDADYYAFADQDDVWDHDKMAAAVALLAPDDENTSCAFDSAAPAIYFSQTRLVDANLLPLPTPQLTPLLTFGESMVYAFATGCTMVLNRSLRDIIVTHRPATLPMLHDYWCYLVAGAIGARVCYDPTPHILYRQHAANVVGLRNRGRLTEWKKRLHRVIVERKAERSRNVKILLDTLASLMTPDHLELAESYARGKQHLATRLRLLTDPRLRCGDKRTYRLFQAALMLNSY